MKAILEITAAVLAVFGAYTILCGVRERIMFPMRVRRALRGAVMLEDADSLCDVSAYARFLRCEQKISPRRLIILVSDDIIIKDEDISPYGDVVIYNKCKETPNDREQEHDR